MSAGLIVRIMHVASSSIHYKPVTLLHRHPSPCRNHGAGTMVWCNFAPWNLIYEAGIGRGWTPYGLIPIPLSRITQSVKGRGESVVRRAEPTLTATRIPNNESGIEIRDSGISWRLLLAIRGDTNLAPNTLIGCKLFHQWSYNLLL